ncbi:hypothetical protein pipiens_017917 [Culex pipiens pipiens]|uniref:Uncharacterized protein n=1 Tax=Culex pipiens pipiens TaxID=38569 RepID=A0ABD1CFF4_CULPP
MVEAPGKLEARDNRKLLGTDKVKTVLNEWEKKVGLIEFFPFNSAPVATACTTSSARSARMTGGDIYNRYRTQLLENNLIKDTRV